MDLQEIKKIAREKGVSNPSDNKTDLIRQIQVAEGYSPCFSTEKRKDCDQLKCLWMPDCVAPSTKPAKQTSTPPPLKQTVAPAPQVSKEECCKPATVTPATTPAKSDPKPVVPPTKPAERKPRKK